MSDQCPYCGAVAGPSPQYEYNFGPKWYTCGTSYSAAFDNDKRSDRCYEREIERLKALREEHEQAWDALLEYVNEVEKSESVFLNYFDEFTDLCQKINDLRPGVEDTQ